MKIAFLFPGQGSQFVGMGESLYSTFSEAKEVFQEIDDILSMNLSKLMFNGEMEDLTLTENAQLAIMAVSSAVIRCLEKQSGKKAFDIATYFAGHSLGEYSANFAAGSMSLSGVACLLKARGVAMARAAKKTEGSMCALIGADFDSIDSICSDYEGINLANDNGALQFVLSGESHAIEKVMQNYQNYGIKKAIKLNVSGAFHSPLMLEAEKEMSDVIESAQVIDARKSIITNVDVLEVTQAPSIKDALKRQITRCVRWRETIEHLLNSGVDTFVELGAGKVLSPIVKRMRSDVKVICVSNPSELEEVCSELRL